MTRAEIVAMVIRDYRDHDVPLILAVIEIESSFSELAFLPDRNGGSYGLMQIDLPTARDRGYAGDGPGLFDPCINVKIGVAQLDWIAADLKRNSAFSVASVIAAYNEGVGNVLRGNPDPRYVARVTAKRTYWQIIVNGAPS